jgi:hypothetical protein
VDTALSKNNVKIRLTSERWLHITEGHSELAGYYFEILDTIENPDRIYKGNNEELLAVKEIGQDKFIVVVYKETNFQDGFVITAFQSRKINYLLNKELLWKK